MSDVLIVGAGVTGIACARVLQDAGLAVRLIDKGRGIGGRMATRRVTIDAAELRLDHGAQYLSDGPEAEAIAAAAPGAVARWDPGDGRARIVGHGGMAALPRALAAGLDVAQGVEVGAVSPDGAGWRVDTDRGTQVAARVVLSVPAPQIAALVGAAHPFARAVRGVFMHPCLTLLAVFPKEAPAPFVTRRAPARALSWIARDDSKPGRGAAARTWIAQANAGWSGAHIDTDRDAIKVRMRDMLCAEIATDPATARHLAVHGWRHGLTGAPLGRAFLRDGTLWAGGDWTMGAKAGDAWRSGQAMAQDILATLAAA
ncbi:NAD(P)/FAD-dependent oxidoreductase [Nioella halotolerans]|uniref:NAD(P)/FAD-dependent oxidoreductase n=1 Tax=Nioella halotolerans TaxID=2303578 RepID=UPI002693484C